MGDSDIMVHPEDRQRAHELLVANGFVNECLGPNEWIYHKGKIEIELHHRLMNDELVSLPSHNEFMETAWENAYSDDGVQFHLDWTYHLTFLFLHLRKHFMNSGVGFRQFMDIAVVSTRCEIDWEKFGQNIEKLAITEFVQNCYAFIKMWFDVEAHVKVKPLDAKFYENSTDKIFDNGIFGFDDKGNKDNYTVIQLRNKNRTHGKIGLFFGSYFPKYSEMAEIPKYGFIKNKPYLLPIAWIYRFFTAISNGAVKKNVVRVNGKMLISQETVDKRENYLREWGL